MATGYIGKLQIDSGNILPIGSTLYGVCDTPAATSAKVIATTDVTLGATFSPLMDGITIHVNLTTAPADHAHEPPGFLISCTAVSPTFRVRELAAALLQ